MQTWSIELSGTITRDIIWREVDAETEQEVREICAREMPMYRVRSVVLASHSDPLSSPLIPPKPSDENSSTT